MRLRRLLASGLIMMLIAMGLVACGDDVTPGPTSSAVTTAPTTTIPATTASTTVPASPTLAALATATPFPVTTAPATPAPATTTAPATTAAPVATTASAKTTVAANASSQAIRATDWSAVYAKDLAAFEAKTLDGPCTSVNGKKDLSGTPRLDQLIYVDMDGDGIEEAAFPLATGGSIGSISFLVYKYAPTKPFITDCGGGYKLGLNLDKGLLQMQQAAFSGVDVECCATGIIFTSYKLVNGKLKEVETHSTGDVYYRPLTVEHFYQLLSDKKLEDAYKILSPAYQKANPFAAWSKGYAGTIKVSARATDKNDGQDTVEVIIGSLDNGAKQSDPPVTKTFGGSWKVVWDTKLQQWTLSNPTIKEVSNPSSLATPKGTVIPLFLPFFGDLKRDNSNIPIYLPTYLSSQNKGDPQIYVEATPDGKSDRYSLRLTVSPICDGAACLWGEIDGEDLGTAKFQPEGTPVTLANGLTGYYKFEACEKGQNCSEPSLTISWLQDKHYKYTFYHTGGSQEEMIKIVNSMITNGELK